MRTMAARTTEAAAAAAAKGDKSKGNGNGSENNRGNIMMGCHFLVIAGR